MTSVETKVRDADAVKALRAKAMTSANAIAKHARLLDPLPPDQNLSDSDHNAVINEYVKMQTLSREEISVVHTAFSASYLHKMCQVLRGYSLITQRKTITLYLVVLSSFPEPVYDPYQRMFLRSPESRGITDFIATAFLDGLERRDDVSPASICRLLTELLHWGDTQEGDDKKACIDSDLRKRLISYTAGFETLNQWNDWSDFDQRAIRRLGNTLTSIDSVPEDMYLKAMQAHLFDKARHGFCANDICPLGKEEPPKNSKRCSRCRSVVYCGEKCQKQHWKNGHNVRCFSRVE